MSRIAGEGVARSGIVPARGPRPDIATPGTRTLEETGFERHTTAAIAVVQRLTAASLLPLVKIWRGTGRVEVHYLETTAGGLRVVAWLRRLGVVDGVPTPVPDKGFAFLDRKSAGLWRDEHRAYELARASYGRMDGTIRAALGGLTSGARAIATANLIKQWADELAPFLHAVRHTARHIASSRKDARVFVIAPRISLADEYRDGAPPVFWQPAIRRSSVLRVLMTVLAAAGHVLQARLRRRRSTSGEARVVATAAWGVTPGRRNDLFWWSNSGIAGRRVLYLTDSPHEPIPSTDHLRAAGIQVVADRNRMPRDAGSALAGSRGGQEARRDSGVVRSLIGRSLTSGAAVRDALLTLAWRHVSARRLAAHLAAANVRAVFDHQEALADPISYASELAAGVRIGAPWSSFGAPCGAALRTHQVFFCWGAQDAQLTVDSGSVSGHILIAGCPTLEMRADSGARAVARRAVAGIRSQGARVVLALFDTNFTPDFYRAFLRWLVANPAVGLVIKSKLNGWTQATIDGLDGLVASGMATGRLHALPDETSPADAAAESDFAVGCVSLSAVILGALAGGRILFVDYEGLDSERFAPFTALRSLGPDRCIFDDPESLQAAVERYILDPQAHPDLGDVAPVLDQWDPFRDGGASARIGAYTRWYLEGLDAGLTREASLREATARYADTWGRDTVIRGLDARDTQREN